MTITILNLDSAYDWTTEVLGIWEQLDWEGIRTATAPDVSQALWQDRRDELGLIGLVSSLVIEEAYCLPQWEEDDRSERADDDLLDKWRERQLHRGRRGPDGGDNDRPRQGRRFNGEEPFFRSPRIGGAGVVECYGMYVRDAGNVLDPLGLLDKVPLAVRHRPAIFLCPERILGVYPDLMGLGEALHHPLPLSSNPVAVNLRMTLLHELGHHFFPVQNSGAGRYLCEALANLFCHHGLSRDEQAWLLYKSWQLQPPEYSAYRPLDVLRGAYPDLGAAVSECFRGSLVGWAAVPKKHLTPSHFGASVSMGFAADGPACEGLLWKELRDRIPDKIKHRLYNGNHHNHHLYRRDDGTIPADLVLDLYRQNDMLPWATTPGLPNDLWCGWGHDGNIKIRWPDDGLHIAANDADRWVEIYDQTPYSWLANTAYKKLITLRHNPSVINYVAKILQAPGFRLVNRSLDEAILHLDGMVTIMDGSDAYKHIEYPYGICESYGNFTNEHFGRGFAYSKPNYNGVVLGDQWIQPLVDFANQKQTKRGYFGPDAPPDYDMIYLRRNYALDFLRYIPSFTPRPLLNHSLDNSIALVKDESADSYHRVWAIHFIEACQDTAGIPALEVAAVSTKPTVGENIRKAALKALATLCSGSAKGKAVIDSTQNS